MHGTSFGISELQHIVKYTKFNYTWMSFSFTDKGK